MQLDFLCQPAFRTQAVAVPHNQHPDHQLRIDRGPAYLAVMGIELLMHIGKRRRHEYIDAPQKVVLRDTVVQPKLIEQARSRRAILLSCGFCLRSVAIGTRRGAFAVVLIHSSRLPEQAAAAGCTEIALSCLRAAQSGEQTLMQAIPKPHSRHFSPARASWQFPVHARII